MLNEWDLLAYVRNQLAAGVPRLTVLLIPDLTGTGRRPAPDADDAYGHARDADARLYALGPDWPQAWHDFSTREQVAYAIQRPEDDPVYGIATFLIGPTSARSTLF
jgi:hypothetical protein